MGIFLAEGQGVEPCDHYYDGHGLAIRCLTARPPLRIKKRK